MESPVDAKTARPSVSTKPPTHVVGIGASAGGLDALERFFASVPEETDLAFVVVQHLSPNFRSLIHELLARHTRLPIELVKDGQRVEAGHVYLIPPTHAPPPHRRRDASGTGVRSSRLSMAGGVTRRMVRRLQP